MIAKRDGEQRVGGATRLRSPATPLAAVLICESAERLAYVAKPLRWLRGWFASRRSDSPTYQYENAAASSFGAI